VGDVYSFIDGKEGEEDREILGRNEWIGYRRKEQKTEEEESII
jgi:hypothetical protein